MWRRHTNLISSVCEPGVGSLSAIWGDFAGQMEPGHVFEWPDASPTTLFSAADLALGSGTVLVVLPMRANDLPSGDLPAEAPRAAVEDIVRSTASSGPFYGPLLMRISEAAIAGRSRPKLNHVPQATIALECLKLAGC